ncbi:unnamed protein product [Rotaria sordida]|uniref:F-box domain-containing protein n=1 Tax=Rotaria sordida TaxID=392033 RepID=A0A815TI31_9BILA|nr:unnamed protein product [Rotaria sordida]
MKRAQNDKIENFNNCNKKPKLENQITIVSNNKSCLENLTDEILFEIFDYLDTYYIYKGFYHLNKRFKNIFINSNISEAINILPMSKLNFENYYINIILPNRNRINLLRLTNPFTLDAIFSPPSIILEFIRLEILILDNIQSKNLSKFFYCLRSLTKFHSLTLSLADNIEFLNDIFSNILSLSKLKYCKIIYQTKNDETPFSPFLTIYDRSPIEYLIIDGCFPFDSLNNLLCCLPRLRHLSMNSFRKSSFRDLDEDLPLIELKYLKYVSLKFNYFICYNDFENLAKKFFYHVQTLRLTTTGDEEYLNAKRWKKLILSSMPYLNIFDINHDGSIRNNNFTYHDIINRFNSSFWLENEWFFTHRHEWPERLDCGIFYSTNQYRRQEYKFHWEFENQICPNIQETRLNSVKHLLICGKQVANNSVNYFPNVTQLTIEHYFKTSSDNSISKILNRLIPLKQLTKLIIKSYDFPFIVIVKLLHFTPKLTTLKFDSFVLDEMNMKLFEQSKLFEYVSNTNTIKNLEIRNDCLFKQIQLIVNLLPKLEYFKSGMNRKEIGNIIRFLITKPNNKIQNLFFICISETPKICLREINLLIKLENLLNDYFIKYINRDLYLWW